jgi:hypothetical protein
VVLAEENLPAPPALATPELSAVAAAIQTEPVPATMADNSVRDEEHFTLHIVPTREKRQPSRDYTWRKRRVETPFAIYWHDVAESFLRDWRAFCASFAPQVSAFAGNVPQHADSIRRKVITPLRSWLRTPMQRFRSGNVQPKPPANKS